jgi:hypothetical protein
MKRFIGQRINGNVNSRMGSYLLVARIGCSIRQMVSLSGEDDIRVYEEVSAVV